MSDEEGFTAHGERYENLVQAGLIDSAKVVRSDLQNAAANCPASAHDRTSSR
jgi:chaperonin GroEL (HSP60 family)